MKETDNEGLEKGSTNSRSLSFLLLKFSGQISVKLLLFWEDRPEKSSRLEYLNKEGEENKETLKRLINIKAVFTIFKAFQMLHNQCILNPSTKNQVVTT